MPAKSIPFYQEKKAQHLTVLEIHPISDPYSSLTKAESLSHPLSNGICVGKGGILTRHLVALNKISLLSKEEGQNRCSVNNHSM